jgi:hypothetical protein
MSRPEELADRLEAIAEEIADLAIDEIRGAIRAGSTSRPASEKRLTQARRAVEKAIHLLRTADRSAGEADEAGDD